MGADYSQGPLSLLSLVEGKRALGVAFGDLDHPAFLWGLGPGSMSNRFPRQEHSHAGFRQSAPVTGMELG